MTLSSILALLATQAIVAAPSGQVPLTAPPETTEQAVDRIFYPAFQAEMMLSRVVDPHPVTGLAFSRLGQERGCAAYRVAWRTAFARHLPAWQRAYREAVLSAVPQQALFSGERQFMDPAVTGAYGQQVVTALQASSAVTTIETMRVEILTSIRDAAAAAGDASSPATVDPNQPGGLTRLCNVTLEMLEGKE